MGPCYRGAPPLGSANHCPAHARARDGYPPLEQPLATGPGASSAGGNTPGRPNVLAIRTSALGELAVVVWPVTEAPPESSSCSELETLASGTGHTVPAQVRARLAEAAAASLDDISTALLGEVSVGCLVGEPRLADRLHLQAEALSSQPGAMSRPRGHTRSRRLPRRMRVPARAAARPPDGVRQQLPPGRLASEPRRRRSAHQCPRGSPQLRRARRTRSLAQRDSMGCEAGRRRLPCAREPVRGGDAGASNERSWCQSHAQTRPTRRAGSRPWPGLRSERRSPLS